MNQLAELPDDRLCVVVFGPGYGESVVVRTPCGAWLVVDSLRDPTTGINPALRLLRANDAQASCLILTHPHEDHAAGFEDLVAAQSGGPVGYVEVSGANIFDPLRDPDAERGLRTGRAEHAVAAIRDRWDSDPASRWSLALGDMRMLGDAAIRVLSPHRDAVAEARRKGAEDLNRLSSALAIEWKGVRLVLGADVPASQWRRIVRDHPTSAPGEHAGLKVPHHGSQASQHPALAEPVDGRPRCWMLTEADCSRASRTAKGWSSCCLASSRSIRRPCPSTCRSPVIRRWHRAVTSRARLHAAASAVRTLCSSTIAHRRHQLRHGWPPRSRPTAA